VAGCRFYWDFGAVISGIAAAKGFQWNRMPMTQPGPDLTTISRSSFLNLLTSAIQMKYHCHAVHLESLRVIEQRWGERIWEGSVETFALVGHMSAKRCYAWVDTPAESPSQFVAVLQKGLVRSPETAVRGWLASIHVAVESPLEYNVDSQIISPAELRG
jgi:hypothetical protein